MPINDQLKQPRDGWGLLYLALSANNADKPEIPDSIGHALIWPNHRVCVALTRTSETESMASDGWDVIYASDTVIRAANPLAQLIDTILVSLAVRQNEASVTTTTSLWETMMVTELTRRGYPAPQRNYEHRFVNTAGIETFTRPDLCWQDRQIVIEVDGFYFHGGREHAAMTKTAGTKTSGQATAEFQKKMAKEQDKRNALNAAGFRVLVASNHVFTSTQTVADWVTSTFVPVWENSGPKEI